MRALTTFLLMVCSAGASCDKRPDEPPGRREVLPVVQSAGTEQPQPSAAAAAPSAAQARERCVVPVLAAPAAKPATHSPLDPVFGGVRLATARVRFTEAASEPSVEVELATNPEQQERGLMYRTQMPENSGMLFAFGAPSVHSF